MNWKEIKEKYPKAWEKACKWGFAEGWDTELEEGEMTFDFYPMNFFYFFDEQGIHIEIEYDPNFNGKSPLWGWLIYDLEGYVDNKIGFNSRKEAEEQAFLKAFELLEKQC